MPLNEISDVQDDEVEIDVTDQLTSTIKSNLLNHAGKPIRKYIAAVSEARI